MSTYHMLFTHNIIHIAHEIFKIKVSPGDTVIDATCGNGKDSLILAQLLQGQGKLVVYDIQKEALNSARVLFQQHLSKQEQAVIQMKEESHEYFTEKDVQLIHYNLGYLPRGNRAVTTLETTTKTSLECALKIVSLDGLITIICYPGHPEGEKETFAVEGVAKSLDPKQWLVSSFYIINRCRAPRLFIFQRQGTER
ncbi:hypothetical protein,tRNA(1-methyladenosine) methyltransferase and related methyltransferases,Putative rRNA methylase [Chlamydia serpentis]|uniref:SAM-dependent methyltransferase n=1 Tax=Chlamydia serpentis TaxID=1967782 RepID=A0A2R8FCM2_9CHLA|nr:class I SAM-dependent methyltransferase [Chlamydia serpentis]SPN74092.1 hypothetical protein,tRNA(1-methyladenosine) methyltransferase and related methyltransferases,Putative rRNA methylase [Chlamydia serpentis]